MVDIVSDGDGKHRGGGFHLPLPRLKKGYDLPKVSTNKDKEWRFNGSFPKISFLSQI